MRPTFVTAITVLSVLTSLLVGCKTTEYTLYLQDVNVKGPISQPPVNITSNNLEKPLRITSHISFRMDNKRTIAGQIEGHSQVDAEGRYLVDTLINGTNNTVTFRERMGANNITFAGQNLHWELPSASFGVDVDYTLSKHWAPTIQQPTARDSGGTVSGLACFPSKAILQSASMAASVGSSFSTRLQRS